MTEVVGVLGGLVMMPYIMRFIMGKEANEKIVAMEAVLENKVEMADHYWRYYAFADVNTHPMVTGKFVDLTEIIKAKLKSGEWVISVNETVEGEKK